MRSRTSSHVSVSGLCVLFLLLCTVDGIPMLYKSMQLVPIMSLDQNQPLLNGQPSSLRLSIGDIIQNSGFFPIQINVPDTISAIYQGVSSAATNIAQQIPFFRPFVRPETPRPLKYIIVAPGKGVMLSKGVYVVPIYKQRVTVIDVPEMEENSQEYGKDIVLANVKM